MEWREKVSKEKRRAFLDEEYWGKPVPGFGDERAQVFVVGLAPGAHGSNRTGRQFTGDASGDFFYPALHRAGFASQALSTHCGDGLRLINLYTAPVCRCAPPMNKPTLDEMRNCELWLRTELEIIHPKVIVVLGKIAFDKISEIYHPSNPRFLHGSIYSVLHPVTDSPHWIVASYHPSRQNTQTGRLTTDMFDQIWNKVNSLLER